MEMSCKVRSDCLGVYRIPAHPDNAEQLYQQ